MNDITTFTSERFGSVRTLDVCGEPWFIGKDVAAVLGYSNARDAIRKHVDDEDKGVANCDTLGGSQELTIINESGLYSLILSSKLPNAKEFKRWVTSEILPAIRKHGAYMTPDTIEQALTDPDTIIKIATQLKEERQKRKALETQAELDRPKVVFADAVSAAQTSILVGELAKLIKQNGHDIGQRRMFAWLRESGYLMKQGSSRNMPTQRSMELGLFEIKETTIANPDGSVRITKTPKVTGKGQQYFINRFLRGEQDGGTA